MKEWVWKWNRPLHRALLTLLFTKSVQFLYVPRIYYMCKGLWDGSYGLLSLSEKTRKSNHLQMLLQRQHFLLSYFKDPGQALNLWPPALQTSTYPIELVRL